MARLHRDLLAKDRPRLVYDPVDLLRLDGVSMLIVFRVMPRRWVGSLVCRVGVARCSVPNLVSLVISVKNS